MSENKHQLTERRIFSLLNAIILILLVETARFMKRSIKEQVSRRTTAQHGSQLRLDFAFFDPKSLRQVQCMIPHHSHASDSCHRRGSRARIDVAHCDLCKHEKVTVEPLDLEIRLFLPQEALLEKPLSTQFCEVISTLDVGCSLQCRVH